MGYYLGNVGNVGNVGNMGNAGNLFLANVDNLLENSAKIVS